MPPDANRLAGIWLRLYAAWLAAFLGSAATLLGAAGPNERVIAELERVAGRASDPAYPGCWPWRGGVVCSALEARPPDFACTVALVLGAISLVAPTLLHQRALRRLFERSPKRLTVDASGASYRSPLRLVPGFTGPERVARLAADRYLQRLSLALALVLAVDITAFAVAQPTVAFDGGGPSPRTYLPGPLEYAPLVIFVTLLLLAHLPTRRRVFGAWRPPALRCCRSGDERVARA